MLITPTLDRIWTSTWFKAEIMHLESYASCCLIVPKRRLSKLLKNAQCNQLGVWPTMLLCAKRPKSSTASSQSREHSSSFSISYFQILSQSDKTSVLEMVRLLHKIDLVPTCETDILTRDSHSRSYTTEEEPANWSLKSSKLECPSLRTSVVA